MLAFIRAPDLEGQPCMQWASIRNTTTGCLKKDIIFPI